ncbi:uncharacterized protein EV420DRAFT_1615763, partial [Desarmillaria tabescens]
MSAPDRFALLHAALEKAPALWDTDVADSLCQIEIAEQAGNAHVLLAAYCATFAHPHPTIVDRFFATASKAVHGIPERLVHPDWKLWACSPKIANKVLKAGVFTMADAKFLREPSPPPAPVPAATSNSKKRKPHGRSPSTRPLKDQASSSVDEERDLLPSLRKEKETASSSRTSSKHPKRDQVSPSVDEERELSPLPSKKEATTTKRKGTIPPPTVLGKESSAAPEKSQVKGRGCKTVVKEEPTVPRAKEPTPPPAILAEDTHVDIRGRSPTPVTAEYMLERILTDSPLLSAMRLPHKDATGFLCQHKEPLMTCTNCNKWGHCSCRLSASDLQEVHDNLLTSAQAAYPFMEMHDRLFQSADRTIRHLLNALHKTTESALRHCVTCYKHSLKLKVTTIPMRSSILHVNFRLDAACLSTWGCLLPAPQLRHYYPHPLTMHSETDPKPQLPEFTILENQTSTPRT